MTTQNCQIEFHLADLIPVSSTASAPMSRRTSPNPGQSSALRQDQRRHHPRRHHQTLQQPQQNRNQSRIILNQLNVTDSLHEDIVLSLTTKSSVEISTIENAKRCLITPQIAIEIFSNSIMSSLFTGMVSKMVIFRYGLNMQTNLYLIYVKNDGQKVSRIIMSMATKVHLGVMSLLTFNGTRIHKHISKLIKAVIHCAEERRLNTSSEISHIGTMKG
ncbi:hypothetical protein PoB_007589800 [Plakobranchus ocellatus]|uniref:Uncharacterized protein n=1 Tax=Plakobranchus ocellatus TaxID=259542 RepID=A0AAV4DYF0_9GAST|nr:hypothetical protein PoB_007589800 [Plakobranchus ocellatus]